MNTEELYYTKLVNVAILDSRLWIDEQRRESMTQTKSTYVLARLYIHSFHAYCTLNEELVKIWLYRLQNKLIRRIATFMLSTTFDNIIPLSVSINGMIIVRQPMIFYYSLDIFGLKTKSSNVQCRKHWCSLLCSSTYSRISSRKNKDVLN